MKCKIGSSEPQIIFTDSSRLRFGEILRCKTVNTEPKSDNTDILK